MANATDELAQAIEDVERIARAIYEEATNLANQVGMDRSFRPWDRLAEAGREGYREMVRTLLRRDVIRVGQRPSAERPLEGQTTIDEIRARS